MIIGDQAIPSRTTFRVIRKVEKNRDLTISVLDRVIFYRNKFVPFYTVVYFFVLLCTFVYFFALFCTFLYCCVPFCTNVSLSVHFCTFGTWVPFLYLFVLFCTF